MFEAAAIILAGGKSSRLKIPKISLKLGGKSLLEINIKKLTSLVAQILIVTSSSESREDYTLKELPGLVDKFAGKVKLVSDLFPDKGPLGGIYTGLTYSPYLYNLVLACDLPCLNSRLLDYLLENAGEIDVLVPIINGLPEPLLAVYSRRCLPFISQQLKENDLRVRSFYPRVKVKYLAEEILQLLDPRLFSFFNINTPEDLNKARILFKDIYGNQEEK